MEEMKKMVDIDPQAIIEQYEHEQIVPQRKTKTQYDVKNYLNARLAPNEETKTLTIRLLPFSPDGGTCFHKVTMHTVKVNKGVSPSGWKTYICPPSNKDDEGHTMGEKCPFCELHKEARDLRFSTSDESMKKKYEDIEYINKPREMWIVRCIERGHEEDGVKFWLFNSSRKKDGVYDKMINLYKQRAESAAKKGKTSNIFGLYNGSDLLVTLNKTSDGKTSIQIVDDIPSPLSEDEAQMEAWVKDEKKWYDVYTVKSYEHMSIVARGGVPVYDKEKGCYVDKSEAEEEKNEAERQRVESTLTKVENTFESANGVTIHEDLPF